MNRKPSFDRLQLDLLEWGPIERKLALRRVRCVEPLDKLVLAILEGHIDPETGHWSMSVAQLADECGLSESSCRRILNRLDTDPRCTFIEWGRQRGRKPTFKIVWENIRDAILETGAAGSSASCDRSRRKSSAKADRTLEERSATVGGRFRQIGGGSSVIAVTELHNKELTDLTDIQPPPPTDSEPDAVVVAVVEAKVAKAAEAVAAARSHGMNDATILQHVRHFTDHPGRWGAGALAKRLESPTTRYLAADQGWPPDSPGYKPAAPAQHVRTVDQLTDSEVRSLLSPDDQHALHEFCRQNPRGDPRGVPHFRKALEQAISERIGKQLAGV